jgi:guanosine-3',5'-bis(diphosphate) 3'-pyrophosphohydrolase
MGWRCGSGWPTGGWFAFAGHAGKLKSMSSLERAIEIASSAHAGQVDKAGQPYILHPLRVMMRLTGEQERIAAVLHDVVEDTAVTFEQLASEGFSPAVLTALDALTKRPGETRLEAAKRAVMNAVARSVKLADNADNMDLSRIANPTASDFARLREYEEVRALLIADCTDQCVAPADR